jgi:UDP-N-acetylmuramate--alanine ligase
METLQWDSIKHIHFVGIKGVAMASLAIWAKESGYTVTGSDVKDAFPTDETLKQAGIRPYIDFDAKHVAHVDLVIYTGAHNGIHNNEVVAAKKKHIPVLAHGQALGEITKDKRLIAVAGCHGKTTTSAMIATILTHAGFDPSYAIGSGMIQGLGLPGHAGKSNYFVVEADEYVTDPTSDVTPRFLWLSPEVLVVTNVDFDHPDVYKDLSAVGHEYQRLVDRMKGRLLFIWNHDDKPSEEYLGSKPVKHITFGERSGMYKVTMKKSTATHQVFLLHLEDQVIEYTLQIPGKHNVMNAVSAILATRGLGLDPEVIKESLAQFGGASRRFEQIGNDMKTIYIDDYAHHPNEIKATLSAARGRYSKKKIIAVFQPHTYTRTKAFMDDFAQAFTQADDILITDIYASAREKKSSITGKDVVNKIRAYSPNVQFVKDKKELFKALESYIDTDAVIIYMGAGDIGIWGREFFKKHYE